MDLSIENLRYPIGKFIKPTNITTSQLNEHKNVIQTFPTKLISEVKHLEDFKLDTAYRPEGWTIRQVISHCADSHMNAIIRFKLALTEDNPTIKPYKENLWAEIEDSTKLPIDYSLSIIEGVHHKWVTILQSMDDDQFQRKYFHPEQNIYYSLSTACALYAWHCQHHLAHITELKKRNNWN